MKFSFSNIIGYSPKKGSKQKAYLALLATSIIWGTTWVASKIGVSTMPAFQMAASG